MCHKICLLDQIFSDLSTLLVKTFLFPPIIFVSFPDSLIFMHGKNAVLTPANPC